MTKSGEQFALASLTPNSGRLVPRFPRDLRLYACNCKSTTVDSAEEERPLSGEKRSAECPRRDVHTVPNEQHTHIIHVTFMLIATPPYSLTVRHCLFPTS